MSAPTTPPCHDGKIEKPEKAAEALQAPRRAHAEQFAQDQTEVPRRDLDQVTFLDFDGATQPSTARSSRLADVCESSFGHLTAQSLQALAPLTTHAPAIRICRRF